MRIDKYPLDFDRRPLDLLAAVVTDATGNGGARFPIDVVGPDGAPIDRVGLVLLNADGTPFTGGAGAVSAATAFAATIGDVAAAPVNLGMVYLTARPGWFKLISNTGLATLIASDTFSGIFIPSTVDSSKVWMRQFDGEIYASWFGFADGASNNAARLMSACAVLGASRGNTVVLPWGTTTMDATVVLTRACIIRGMGGGEGSSEGNAQAATLLVFPTGITNFRCLQYPNNGQCSRFEDFRTANAGTNTSTALGTMSTPTTVTLNSAWDLQPGQAVLLEGAGPRFDLEDRKFTPVAGNSVVSWTTPDGVYRGNAVGYVGQMVNIAGAGLPANTYITAWSPSTVTLSNAPTVSIPGGAPLTLYMPQVGEVQSGAGTTTITLDSWSGDPHAVTNAVIRHAAPGLYTRVQVHANNVEFMGQVSVIFGGNTGSGAIADNSVFTNCFFQSTVYGVIFQGDDAQVNSFYGCNFAGPIAAILDMSQLGNYYVTCHWAFNNGIQVSRSGARTQIIGGYMETGTSYLAIIGASMFFSTESMYSGSGFRGFNSVGSAVRGPSLDLNGYLNCMDDGHGNGALNSYGQVNFYDTKSYVSGLGNVFYCRLNALGSGNYVRMYCNGSSGVYISTATDMRLNAESGQVQFRLSDATLSYVDANGMNVISGKAYYQAGDKVVGARQGAIADAAALTSVNGTNAAAAPTQAEFNALVAEFNKLRTDLAAVRTPFNTLLAALRASTGHGLIA